MNIKDLYVQSYIGGQLAKKEAKLNNFMSPTLKRTIDEIIQMYPHVSLKGRWVDGLGRVHAPASKKIQNAINKKIRRALARNDAVLKRYATMLKDNDLIWRQTPRFDANRKHALWYAGRTELLGGEALRPLKRSDSLSFGQRTREANNAVITDLLKDQVWNASDAMSNPERYLRAKQLLVEGQIKRLNDSLIRSNGYELIPLQTPELHGELKKWYGVDNRNLKQVQDFVKKRGARASANNEGYAGVYINGWETDR